MSSNSERRRNNLRAGIFVTAAIALGLATMVALSDVAAMFAAADRQYAAHFDLAGGVKNLKAGSEVRVGGIPMGRVTEVAPVADSGSVEAFTDRIAVRFTLDARYSLYDQATVSVGGALIGSDAWLAISDLGGPEPRGDNTAQPTPVLDETTAIMGSSVSTLESLAGPKGPGLIDKVDGILTNAETFSESLSEFDVAGLQEEARDFLALLEESGVEVRDFLVTFTDEQWVAWAARIDELFDWANSATTELDATLLAGRETAESAQRTMTDVEPRVKRIAEQAELSVESVERITRAFEQTTMAKANQLLDTAQASLDQTAGLLEDIRTDYPGWSQYLGDSLANANLASQQLKLATIEIRDNPWKLLYQPAPDEIRQELLYDAARAFALATTDLRAAAESFERTLDEHGERIDASEDLRNRVSRNIMRSLDNYERAQQQLLEVLKLDQ